MHNFWSKTETFLPDFEWKSMFYYANNPNNTRFMDM